METCKTGTQQTEKTLLRLSERLASLAVMGAQSRDPLERLNNICGISGGPSIGPPIMPKDTSLSDSCTPVHCSLYSPVFRSATSRWFFFVVQVVVKTAGLSTQ